MIILWCYRNGRTPYRRTQDLHSLNLLMRGGKCKLFFLVIFHTKTNVHFLHLDFYEIWCNILEGDALYAKVCKNKSIHFRFMLLEWRQLVSFTYFKWFMFQASVSRHEGSHCPCRQWGWVYPQQAESRRCSQTCWVWGQSVLVDHCAHGFMFNCLSYMKYKRDSTMWR